VILGVLWILNDLVRIRFLLFRSFRILPFKTDQQNHWQILSVHDGTSEKNLHTFKDFQGKYVCNQRKIYHFEEEEVAENLQIFLSGSDLAKKSLIRQNLCSIIAVEQLINRQRL